MCSQEFGRHSQRSIGYSTIYEAEEKGGFLFCFFFFFWQDLLISAVCYTEKAHWKSNLLTFLY